MRPIAEDHPLRRMFKGLVDAAFCAEIGVCDPTLTDYIADLLVSFVHVDALQAAQRGRGRRLYQLADMLEEVFGDDEGDSGPADFHLHRHIGDFALFWSGVYPESLRRRRGLAGKDHLLDYVVHGKRSYAIAADLGDDDTSPPSALLSRLSREFEVCCHGLGLVRRSWEDADPGGANATRGLVY